MLRVLVWLATLAVAAVAITFAATQQGVLGALALWVAFGLVVPLWHYKLVGDLAELLVVIALGPVGLAINLSGKLCGDY